MWWKEEARNIAHDGHGYQHGGKLRNDHAHAGDARVGRGTVDKDGLQEDVGARVSSQPVAHDVGPVDSLEFGVKDEADAHVKFDSGNIQVVREFHDEDAEPRSKLLGELVPVHLVEVNEIDQWRGP
ncbi:hypothetical protein PC114_g25345 [Phytophthora cactorum]|nr:hypothetical protein PC112_g22826 [Phytophthora cactorum]KAG2874310.1 hypothetical protein PC114_g25345 [Phytophthora cactorum]KAG2981896.1 hypothetical protein PC120_g24740 [Phytophthora cactorum]KAG4038620.1 hypothetical protein PC123_g25817 [Phytophthora cactorum]